MHQTFFPGCAFRSAFLVIAFLFLKLISPSESFAQGGENTALWSENGYSLKKVVSNTTIASGVNFSYTIIFSAPAGVTSISIQDQVPAALQVVSVTAAGPVCSVSPVTGVSGNLVTYNLTSLPGSCAPSGSFTIVVKFPEGVTCDGAAARNRAEILIDDKWQPTPYVSTVATAVNPWKVTKTIISGASVNPNGGSCGYIMAPGDTITYRLAVLKDNPYWGNVVGQQNMSTAVVTDLLPAGAQFVSSSNPCATHPGGTGGTITWNVNCPTQLLDAANPWAYYWVDIKVAYPAGSFPVNTQILNQATLTGVSCNQQASHTSNQTCITVTQPNPSGNFSKWLSLTNRVPGCSGLYIISFCNNGNVPLTAFNINDNIPSGITVNQIQISGANSTTSLNLNINSTPFATGISTFYASGTISSPVSNVQVQMTNSLPVGGCIYIYVYFTINPNPTGTVVTNCATFDPLANGLTLPQVCASFTVEAGTPKPCLIKDVCAPQSSYDPGDIVRFRLRIQNIGSADLIGSAIQDVLHSNFTYIGNETYYSANTYNVPCSTGGTPPSGTSVWTGVTPSHSGNNLSWNLPDIAADCQLFYAAYCGYYGTWGIPYYYIEFDAQVTNFALPGVTPNSYQVSGGNLPAPVVSNTVNILVVASFGQEVHKLLSTDNGASYSSSGTAAPGSTARFRLNYKNTSNVPVSSIGLTDLLGRNDGTDDWLIFNRTLPRGSQFDVSYIGNHATSLMPAATPPVPTLTWAPGQNICLPPYVTTGCTGSAFGAVPDRNIRAAYGTVFSLAPNASLNEDFDVGIPLTALNAEMVCNDFAAIASANFLLNGNPQSVALTPVASPPVCLTIDSTLVTVSCCDSVLIEQAVGADGTIGCCARIKTTCEVDSVAVSISNGTFSSSSWNCGNIPGTHVGQSSYTFVGNNCVLDMVNCIEPDSTGIVVISYVIYFANGEVCEKRIVLDCVVEEPSCCDSVKVDIYHDATGAPGCCARITTTCEVDSVAVSISNGTFSSSSWNCGNMPGAHVGQSSYTFVGNNCVLDMVNCIEPDSTGIVVISYVIHFANGEVCEKRIELDCVVEEPACCEHVKLEKYTDPDGTEDCCVQLTTECEVKSVEVSVTNGTIASAAWNCGPLPAGYVGQSNFTFAPGNCALDMKLCVNATTTGLVVIHYVITFANGEVCEKRIEMDCKVEEPSCCDSVKVDIYHDATGVPGCCARIITTCEVDSVAVSISNGTFSSSSWNCGNMPGAHVGQSSYTFVGLNCVLDMVNCIEPDSTGIVVISYVIYFANGEVCEKRIELDCVVEEPACCDSVKVDIYHDATGAPGCCARIITTCEVDSVAVSISNGTFSSSSWNCGNMPGAHVGQSSYTFVGNNCVLDMVNCIEPDSTGIVVISYVIHFANGDVCEKRIELDCVVEEPACCEHVKLEKYTDPDGTEDCCVQLTTECEVKSVEVSVTNGTIASAAWNCGPLPAGYVGQSNFTFAPGNCALDMKLCVNATTTGLVVINYVITFANGEVCEKRIELDCKAVEETCCALADFKLKTKWPFWKSQVGTFNIINADPSVPICYVEINAVPAATFTMGSLIVDGVASSQAWNPTRIPASGNLSPTAINTIDFSLTASNYKGTITVCVVKCDGTRCCFEFKWNGLVVIDVDVDIDKDPIKTGLMAVRLSPVVNEPGERMIKYVSFGLTDEIEVEENTSEFFAISASPHEGDDYPANLETSISSYMGKSSAFFELANPKSAAGGIGFFNLVFAGKAPKLGCTLYDEDGDILYSGEIIITDEDTISTSYSILSAAGAGNMFEFINLFPNPSNGNFAITYVTGTPRDVEIRLVSLTGQVLHVQNNPGTRAGVHNVGLNIDRLPVGIYTVVLVSEGEVLSKSLIIQ